MESLSHEEIMKFLKKYTDLYVSTSINGLPNIACMPFRVQNSDGGKILINIKVHRGSIEYNQLLFNRNCSLYIGSKEEGLRIYGLAFIDKYDEIEGEVQENREDFSSIQIIPKEISLEKSNELRQQVIEKPEPQGKIIKSNLKSEFKFWFRITRAPFFTATIMPILLGIALAWVLQDVFSPILTLLTLIAGLCIHSGTNLINDYYDQRTDELNSQSTPFSGGSRTIQLRLASQEKILFSALTSFILGIGIISAILLYLESIELFILLVLGIFLAFFYSAGPLKLSHHGLGELSNFLGYGPILTISAWLIETKGIYTMNNLLLVTYWSFVPGLLLTLILLINEFQDFDSDKAAGKRTLIVRLGKKKGQLAYNLVGGLTYLIILVGVFIDLHKTIFGLVALVGIYLLYKATKIIANNLYKIQELLPANALTVQNHLLTNLLLVVGFIITKILIG